MHCGTFGGSTIGVSQYALKYRTAREGVDCSAASSRRINTLGVVTERQLQIYWGTEDFAMPAGVVSCGTLECRVDCTDSNIGTSTARGRGMPMDGVMKEPKLGSWSLCLWVVRKLVKLISLEEPSDICFCSLGCWLRSNNSTYARVSCV
jgi:hypothetical protein